MLLKGTPLSGAFVLRHAVEDGHDGEADDRQHRDRQQQALGSGLIDYSQKMTMAAMQIADMNV